MNPIYEIKGNWWFNSFLTKYNFLGIRFIIDTDVNNKVAVYIVF